jgi:hypothetical protein
MNDSSKANLVLPKKLDILKGLNNHVKSLKAESASRLLATHIVYGNLTVKSKNPKIIFVVYSQQY